MRYYFRDNRPSAMARFFLSAAVLVALISAIGGFYYSKGLPFASNPFAGFRDDLKDSEADEENLEPIFIPIRKKFPPDPFPGSEHKTSGKTAPAANEASRSQTSVPAVPKSVSPPVSARAGQGGISAAESVKKSVAEKAHDSGLQNKVVEPGTANPGKQNPAGSTQVEMPSGIASAPGDSIRRTEARSLALVKQQSLSPRSEPARVKQIAKPEPAKPAVSEKPTRKTKPVKTARPAKPAVSEKPTRKTKPVKTARPAKPTVSEKPTRKTKPVKTAKPAKPAELARSGRLKKPTGSSGKREVAVIRSKPASSTLRSKTPAATAVQARSADSKSSPRLEQPKYRDLDTVVEISDSGDTVAGRRWKDISSSSE